MTGLSKELKLLLMTVSNYVMDFNLLLADFVPMLILLYIK